MYDPLPPCPVCGKHYCTAGCPGPRPSERVTTLPPPPEPPLPEVERAHMLRRFLSALCDLRAELELKEPSPFNLESCATRIALACPLEVRALAGPVVRLCKAYSGCLGAQRDWPSRDALAGLRDALSDACCELQAAAERGVG